MIDDEERIAEELCRLGVDARVIDGWVYVLLAEGGVMCISADYGASLDASVYSAVPSWFTGAPATSGRKT